jgi:hypothetical protein
MTDQVNSTPNSDPQTEVQPTVDHEAISENLILGAMRMAQSMEGGNQIIARALGRFKAPAEDQGIEIARDGTVIREIYVMQRNDHELIEGTVESDTLYATFQAGTPILREPGAAYEGSLDWLHSEGLLEDDDSGVQRLTEAVRFVTPNTAMAMTIGANKSWAGEDERKIDFRDFDVATVREFVKTGVKVRRV